jgi:hypothetical protein
MKINLGFFSEMPRFNKAYRYILLNGTSEGNMRSIIVLCIISTLVACKARNSHSEAKQLEGGLAPDGTSRLLMYSASLRGKAPFNVYVEHCKEGLGGLNALECETIASDSWRAISPKLVAAGFYENSIDSIGAKYLSSQKVYKRSDHKALELISSVLKRHFAAETEPFGDLEEGFGVRSSGVIHRPDTPGTLKDGSGVIHRPDTPGTMQ